MIYGITSRVRIIVLGRKQPVVVARTLHTHIHIIVVTNIILIRKYRA